MRKSKGRKTPEQELSSHAQDIRREIVHWLHLRDHGCQDPFWEDGTNMNLTRNHVIYAKHQIDELCRKYGLPVPLERYIETPPKVPSEYYAGPRTGPRWERLRARGRKLVTSQRAVPAYDPDSGQMSLF